MKTLTVSLSKKYDIRIGGGLLNGAGALIKTAVGPERVMLVTDDIVGPLYAERLRRSLDAAGIGCESFVVPNGEASKSTSMLLRLADRLAEERFTRTDAAIALGGGVVGDLTGFAASIYLRGIKLVQAPTTLLAAVDSSVGGKTAVNLSQGKNLLGSFYQPDLVICDHDTLRTLPPEIFSDGCAEVIKHAFIRDNRLLALCEVSIGDNIEEVIYRCLDIKQEIVSRDERDTGVRQLLNFGHTLGHAIEVLSRFRVLHGYAVSAGLAVMTRAARLHGFCGVETERELVGLLKKYGLPTTCQYSAGELAGAVLRDKKRSGGSINIVIPRDIGRLELLKLDCRDVKDFIAPALEGEAQA